jgi:tetratricopeptide (TPR) repeat protein
MSGIEPRPAAPSHDSLLIRAFARMDSPTLPLWLEKSGLWLARPLIAWLACLLAAFLVYAPALGGDLIWDDFYLVGENPFFRSPVFGLEAFRHYLFFDSFSTYYRPVQNWSYIFDYWLWGGAPLGYHCTNIVLHAHCGFLLFLLLRRLLPGLCAALAEKERGSTGAVALLVALVWLVHPIHNAAVAYISGRADSLAALFALSAWLLVLQALEKCVPWKKAALGLLAGAALLVALCSKEIALVWLILLLGHLFGFDRQHPRTAKWAVLAGVAAILGAYAVLHALPGYRAPMQDGGPPPWDARVLLMFRALGDYASLIFYPGRLYMERAISDPGIYRNLAAWREHARYEYLSILGLLALLAAIWLCAKRDPGRRLRLFGAAWFAVAFLPISNLFPLNAEVAEHWIYLASIGALLFLAGAILALPPRLHLACTGLAVLALAGLGARTAVRSGDWINAETFCARTIAAGGATPRILSSLAAVHGQRGDYEKQERILRKMIAQFPDYAPARMNLGICLSRQGRAAEAGELLGAARAQAGEVARQYPRTWPAALHLAQLRRKAGHPDEALAILREARARFPETWELVKAESELRRESDGPAAALPPVADFAAAHWWHFDAQITLGALRFAAGQSDAGIAALQHACRLDIHDGRAFAGIAEIELARGRAEAALTAQFAAMERDPDQPRQYAALAGILEKLGRKAEAAAALRKAQLLALEATRGS